MQNLCSRFSGEKVNSFLGWFPQISILFFRYCYRVLFSYMRELYVIYLTLNPSAWLIVDLQQMSAVGKRFLV